MARRPLSLSLKLMLMKIDLVTHASVPRADTDPNQPRLPVVDLLPGFCDKIRERAGDVL